MQIQGKSGKLLPVEQTGNGETYLICPVCRRNRRLMKILPDSSGHNIVAFCRDCKSEIKIDIFEGQCFESRSQ